jgi:hypothetical protein
MMDSYSKQPRKMNGMMMAIGESFSRFKTKLGFGPKKVFHCFRNTFIDEAYQHGMDKTLYKDYVGPAQEDMTHSVMLKKQTF